MDCALSLAHEAAHSGEVPVGAVVADATGRIVGQGRNACIAGHDATAHAEIMAMRQAGQTLGNYRLGGCVLVVTLEPCAMCAAAIVQARLDGLVYGAADTLAGAVCSRAEYLDAPAAARPTWHMGGVRGAACRGLLQDFFADRRNANQR